MLAIGKTVNETNSDFLFLTGEVDHRLRVADHLKRKLVAASIRPGEAPQFGVDSWCRFRLAWSHDPSRLSAYKTSPTFITPERNVLV